MHARHKPFHCCVPCSRFPAPLAFFPAPSALTWPGCQQLCVPASSTSPHLWTPHLLPPSCRYWTSKAEKEGKSPFQDPLAQIGACRVVRDGGWGRGRWMQGLVGQQASGAEPAAMHNNRQAAAQRWAGWDCVSEASQEGVSSWSAPAVGQRGMGSWLSGAGSRAERGRSSGMDVQASTPALRLRLLLPALCRCAPLSTWPTCPHAPHPSLLGPGLPAARPALPQASLPSSSPSSSWPLVSEVLTLVHAC